MLESYLMIPEVGTIWPRPDISKVKLYAKHPWKLQSPNAPLTSALHTKNVRQTHNLRAVGQASRTGSTRQHCYAVNPPIRSKTFKHQHAGASNRLKQSNTDRFFFEAAREKRQRKRKKWKRRKKKEKTLQPRLPKHARFHLPSSKQPPTNTPNSPSQTWSKRQLVTTVRPNNYDVTRMHWKQLLWLGDSCFSLLFISLLLLLLLSPLSGPGELNRTIGRARSY